MSTLENFWTCLFLLGVIGISFPSESIQASNTRNTPVGELSTSEFHLLYKRESEIEKRYILTNEYLKQARTEQNNEKIALAMRLRSKLISDTDEALLYLDSLINFSRNARIKDYPNIAHIDKAGLYYLRDDFESSIMELKEAKKGASPYIQMKINRSLGNLCLDTNNDEKAYQLFIKSLNHFSQNKKKYLFDYLGCIHSIVEYYIGKKETEKAIEYVQLGLGITREHNLRRDEIIFLSRYSSALWLDGKYDKAYPILEEILEFGFLSSYRTAALYRSLVVCSVHTDQINKALTYFDKLKTLYDKDPELAYYVFECCKALSSYFEKHGPVEEEIKYNKLGISVDAALDKSMAANTNEVMTYLSEQTIDELESEKDDLKVISSFLKFSMVLLLLIIGFVYKKKRDEKNSFERRLADILKREAHEKPFSPKTEIRIHENQRSNILDGLTTLEKENFFLDKNCNMQSVASSLGTNTTYLSLVINETRSDSFRTYINNMRIEYLLHQVRTDKRYLEYTIKAIAEEGGFKSTKTFSRAFKKKVGINPSEYLNDRRDAFKNETIKL